MRWRTVSLLAAAVLRALPFLTTLALALLPTLVDARAILNDDHVVHTSLGSIRGIPQNFQGERVSAFLGVPYARPPVGARRFAKPEMIQPWSGELEARTPAKTCFLTIDTTFPQFPGAEMWNPPNGISEDCLNMNIWVPANHDGSVLVWIFGGGFFSGSPSLDLYDGTALAAKKHTIVVNINYRLGPFGFLYLGDDSPVPGNMGLLDQQVALRWIHEHIGSFGGDPTRITLFGESAGSAAATAHIAAPNSYTYFNKIIANSGTIMNSWASRTPDTMLELSLRLAKRLNCTSRGTDAAAIHNCLRAAPAGVIQVEADSVSSDINLPMTFAFVPVSADKNFFQGDVFERLRSRNFKKDVSVIIGTVKDEGTYWLPYYMNRYGFWFNHTISAEDPQNKALITREQYRQSMQAFMPYFGNSPLVEHALLHAYQTVSEKQTLPEQLRDGVGRFLGDYFFTCSLIEFADIIADNVYGPVYMYYFTMRSTANPWPKWMGIMHGYEIEYAFGQPLTRPSLYEKNYLGVEIQFSELIMKLWTDFANTGTPAPYWPKYNRIERKALVLGEESTRGEHRILTDIHGAECRLIDEAETVAGQVSECRARRTQPAAAIQSITNGRSSLTASVFAVVFIFIKALTIT
uniref:Carboxylic ester hydrolase n=1 Tax=Haemonchus contortus TaxID=6289 RepID=A0A7I4XW54_HAECO